MVVIGGDVSAPIPEIACHVVRVTSNIPTIVTIATTLRAELAELRERLRSVTGDMAAGDGRAGSSTERMRRMRQRRKAANGGAW
jgi:hypothetical protein